MFGQSFVEPDDDVPLELPGGDVPEDPEFDEDPLPVDALEPDPPAAVELVELVLGVLVAALATNAPPVTRPPVSAPIARALRRWSFIVLFPFSLMGFPASPHEGTPPLCDMDLWVGPEARHNAIGVCRRPRHSKGRLPQPGHHRLTQPPSLPASCCASSVLCVPSLPERRKRFVDRDGTELPAKLMAHDPHLTSWRRGNGPALALMSCMRRRGPGRRRDCQRRRRCWRGRRCGRRRARAAARVIRSARGLAEYAHMRDSHRRTQITCRVLGQTVKLLLRAAPPYRSGRRLAVIRSPVTVSRPSLGAFHGGHFRRTRAPNRGP